MTTSTHFSNFCKFLKPHNYKSTVLLPRGDYLNKCLSFNSWLKIFAYANTITIKSMNNSTMN